MEQRAELSEFLQSRRARLQPEEVGLRAHGGQRRVPGLRREELAQLAGVSVDYYIRLEQGRARNVSAEVLEAVAQALRLDEAERAHLRDLAKPAPPVRRRSAPPPERVRPGLRRLLDMAGDIPAYIVGRRLDVLAWNRMACAFFTDFDALAPADRNLGKMIFLDEGIQSLYDDWTIKAREIVDYLRLKAGAHPDDRPLTTLVGELSVKSDHFRRWWFDHDVRHKTYGRRCFHHPLVGDLILHHETLRVPDEPDQLLVTYTAEAGSPSETALRLIGSWGTGTWALR